MQWYLQEWVVKESKKKNIRLIDGKPLIQYVIEKSKIVTPGGIYNNNTPENLLAAVNGACELISKGWEKEAIPIIHKKKSFISGFFSKLFN